MELYPRRRSVARSRWERIPRIIPSIVPVGRAAPARAALLPGKNVRGGVVEDGQEIRGTCPARGILPPPVGKADAGLGVIEKDVPRLQRGRLSGGGGGFLSERMLEKPDVDGGLSLPARSLPAGLGVVRASSAA